MRSRLIPASALAATALVLTSCATGPTDSGSGAAASGGPADAAADGAIAVVASTSAYGEIARAIGGDDVSITALVTGQAQDPHEYEPSAKDRLIASTAQLIVMNGGGYDAYMDNLIGDAATPTITATDFADMPDADDADDDHDDADDHDDDAHDHDDADDHADNADDHDDADEHADDEAHGHVHIDGFNEHVWYDFDVVSDVAEALVEELSALKPEAAADFAQRGAAFEAELDALEHAAGKISAEHVHVFVTEPVPLALIDEADLHNVTPSAFTEAVEEGQDVAPAVLLESISLLTEADVRVVITNTQTGGAETTQIVGEAEKLDIPVIEFSELIPAETSYGEWMQQNIDALSAALAG